MQSLFTKVRTPKVVMPEPKLTGISALIKCDDYRSLPGGQTDLALTQAGSTASEVLIMMMGWVYCSTQ